MAPTRMPALPVLPLRVTLARHDAPAAPPAQTDPLPLDPDPAPTPVEDPPADPAPEPEPAGDKALEALRREREARRKAEAEAKTNRDAARRLKEIEDAQKTEAERTSEALRAAQDRAAAADRRAVTESIRARATEAGFADPADAILALSTGDLSRFLSDDGVDATAITDALGEVLETRPHWRRPDPAPASIPPPPAPRPDPGQGSRGAQPPVDMRTADPDTWDREKAKFGLR